MKSGLYVSPIILIFGKSKYTIAIENLNNACVCIKCRGKSVGEIEMTQELYTSEHTVIQKHTHTL